MAKKSAKSKGYRKSAPKKQYISKKELTITIAVIAAVALAFALFILLYDDGALQLADGKVQVEGENSLIVNTGTGYEPRYFKIGQLTEIEGYTLASAPMGADENVPEYTYTPDADSPIDSITVNSYSLDAETYASSAAYSYSSDPDMESSGVQTLEDDGHTVRYLTFRHTPVEETNPDNIVNEAIDELLEDASDEEAATLEEMAEETEPVLVQALHCYVDAGEDRLVYMLIRNDVESVDEYVDDSILVDAMNQVLAALSYETK